MHVRGSAAVELCTQVQSGTAPTHVHSVARIVALFDDLVSTLEGRTSPLHVMAASGLAWHLLTQIAADRALPQAGSPLERAMSILEGRVDSSIRVRELAARVNVSPSHLTALFRESTGGGPAAFHTRQRMARARTLLDTTDLSVGEIARAVGYADPLYFSRHFRRIHGTSPSSYRNDGKG
jgi:transcriptional regulator GlxA family with amidase domain